MTPFSKAERIGIGKLNNPASDAGLTTPHSGAKHGNVCKLNQ
jgi:hypothetical protein